MGLKCRSLYVASPHWSCSSDHKEHVQICFHKQFVQYLKTSPCCSDLVFLRLITRVCVPLITPCVLSRFCWFSESFPDCLMVWHLEIYSELFSIDSLSTVVRNTLTHKHCWITQHSVQWSQASNHETPTTNLCKLSLRPHRPSLSPRP